MVSNALIKNFGNIPPLVKQFNNQKVEFYQDKKGDVWLTAEQIGTALRYAQPRKSVINIFNRHRVLLEKFSGVIKTMTPGGNQLLTVFNEIAVNFIALKSNTPKANEFALWVSKIIKEYRHQQLVPISAIAPRLERLHSMEKVLFHLNIKVDLVLRALPYLKYDKELDNMLLLRPLKAESVINKMKKEAISLADNNSELKTSDCAKVFNVKPATIRAWIKKGLLTVNTWTDEKNARERISLSSVLDRIEKGFLLKNHSKETSQ